MHLQLEHLPLIPRTHRQRFAAMGDGLMGRFARIAYEGEVFDADGAEAVFGVGAAVGADAVGGEAG